MAILSRFGASLLSMTLPVDLEKSALAKEFIYSCGGTAVTSEKMCRFTELPQYSLSGVTIETKIFDRDRIVGWSLDTWASLRGRMGHEASAGLACGGGRGRLKSRWQNSGQACASLSACELASCPGAPHPPACSTIERMTLLPRDFQILAASGIGACRPVVEPVKQVQGNRGQPR